MQTPFLFVTCTYCPTLLTSKMYKRVGKMGSRTFYCILWIQRIHYVIVEILLTQYKVQGYTPEGVIVSTNFLHPTYLWYANISTSLIIHRLCRCIPKRLHSLHSFRGYLVNRVNNFFLFSLLKDIIIPN